MARVLCVDDTGCILEEYIAKLEGKHTYVVDGGKRIPDVLRRVASMGGLDIAFIDLHLEMSRSGIDYLVPLRKEYPGVPIIIATTDTVALNRRDGFLEAGFTDILGKNYVFENFEELIEKHTKAEDS